MAHPTMRLHPFLLPALVLPLAAQDAWEGFVAELRSESLAARQPWRFIARRALGRAALLSEPLFAARACRDLQREDGTEAVFAALGLRLAESPAPEWALLDPKGEVRAHGRGEPTAQGLLDAMEAGGWRPRWERREAFLREHSDHGDATLDAIKEASQRFFWLRVLVEAKRQKGSEISISWSSGDAPDPEMAKALASPFGETEVVRPCLSVLARFAALPDADPERARAWTDLWNLGMGGATSSPHMLDALRRLLQGVEDELRHNPGSEALWSVWRGLAGFVPEADAEAIGAGLEAAPGCPWPVPGAARALTLKLNPQKTLDRAEAELSGPGDREARLRTWGPIKLQALLGLERFEDAKAWILEARRQARGVFGEAPLDALLDEKNPYRAALQEALDQEVVELEAPETSKALVLLGSPAWSPAFAQLERHPAFDAWGRGWLFAAGELFFHVATGDEEKAVRAKLHLPPGPRWVLFGSDERILAQGTEVPDPDKVAQALRAAAPPLLERLEAFARTHPDHRQAQEQLVEKLSERMPHPRLELKLAQACAALGEAAILRKEDFKPQLPLWETSLRKALPNAESRLVRWPESLDAWMAWMDWQSLRPKPESPMDRWRSLGVWKSLERGGPGPLPLDVASGVAQRLEQAKRWRDLAEWGLAQWEGGWRQAMGWGRSAKGEESPAEQEQRQRVRKDFATLASATLRGLQLAGRKGEAQRFQEELKGGDSGLLAELGRKKE